MHRNIQMRIEGKRKDDELSQSDNQFIIEKKKKKKLVEYYAILSADIQQQKKQYELLKDKLDKYHRFWEIHKKCELRIGDHQDRGGDHRDRGGDRRDRGGDHRDRGGNRGKDRGAIEDNMENVETKTRVRREKNKIIINADMHQRPNT